MRPTLLVCERSTAPPTLAHDRAKNLCLQELATDSEGAMKTPGHHREEAQTCLELARLMIDPHAARILREAAAQHMAQATELEAMLQASGRVPFTVRGSQRAGLSDEPKGSAQCGMPLGENFDR
jgi:hypothetical protein